MAGTVSTDIVNLTLAESADSASWDDIGGGSGSTQSSDLPLQGAETRARRIDAKNIGFGYDNNTGIDISGTHVGYWVNVLQSGSINSGLEFSMSDSSLNCQSGNWNGHRLLADQYRKRGGWIRVWVDASRTRTVGSGSLSLSSVRNFGVKFDMGNVGGNAANCHLDSISYGTSGLSLSGGTSSSPATFQDLISYDDVNDVGIIDDTFIDGAITIGGSNTYFEDQNFAFKSGAQFLANDSWRSITFDLTSPTSEAYITAGFLQGIKVNFLGASGNADLGALSVGQTGAPITLTPVVTWAGSAIACGQLVVAGATINGFTIDSCTDSSAVMYDVAENPLGKLDGITIISDGTGHAIELGPNCPNAITLKDLKVFGYAQVDGITGNETIYNNSGKNVDISTPNRSGDAEISIRNGVGATTNLVVAPATLTLNNLRNPTEVRIYDSVTGVEVAGQEVVTSGNFSASISTATVNIMIVALDYQIIRLKNISMLAGDVSIPVQQQVDRQYENP